MANTGAGGSPVPVQIITNANGQQVIEQVHSISPSMIQQHHSSQAQTEVQMNQQTPIVYTTVSSGPESPVNQQQQQQTVVIQQSPHVHQQNLQQQQQQQHQQVIVHHQPHQPKPKTHFCQHCNKGFAAKHGLQLHNKRHPNGECTVRSHVCGECNRAFFQKNHLLLHQRQHMEQQRTSHVQQVVKVEMSDKSEVAEMQDVGDVEMQDVSVVQMQDVNASHDQV